MQSFKFEIWPVKDYNEDEPHAFVVTRPVQDGEDNDGEPVIRTFSKVHSDVLIAAKEVQLALDNMVKLYKKEQKK